jgi:hypothetical protein
MSVTKVITYFKDRCKANSLTEFTDAFATEIPSTIRDGSFHITLGDVSTRQSLNQHSLVLSCPVTVMVWFKGYRNPAEARDKGIAKGETLITDCMSAANRFTVDIKNIEFNNMGVEALGVDNDNIAQLTLGFTAVVALGIDC